MFGNLEVCELTYWNQALKSRSATSIMHAHTYTNVKWSSDGNFASISIVHWRIWYDSLWSSAVPQALDLHHLNRPSFHGGSRKDNFIDVYHTDYSNKRVILFTEQAAFREDLFPKIPKHWYSKLNQFSGCTVNPSPILSTSRHPHPTSPSYLTLLIVSVMLGPNLHRLKYNLERKEGNNLLPKLSKKIL